MKDNQNSPVTPMAAAIKPETLLDTIQLGVMAIDSKGVIQFANNAAGLMFGAPATDLLGQQLVEFSNELADILACDWSDISAEAKNTSNLEIFTRCRNATSLTLAINIKRLSDSPQGDRLLVMNDITGKTYIENKRQQVKKIDALGTLAGGVAHQYNNLIMVISGYIQRALNHCDDPDRLCRALDRAKKATEEAAIIGKQLLIFSGKHAREHKVTDIPRLINAGRDELLTKVPNGISVRFDLPDENVNAKLDPNQLMEAINILLANAIDAMPQGGEVVVGQKTMETETHAVIALALDMKAGRYISVYIRDEGVGIDATTMDNIFDPFFSTKTDRIARGMGLAIVYGFMKETGGYINVQTSLGAGTEVCLYFRLTDEVEIKTREISQNIPRGNGEVVLVVDDEKGILDLIEGDLESLGYTVLSANDGIEALEIELDFEGKIDLMVSDVMMPGFTGPETSRALLKSRPDVKIIFMSGYAPQSGDRRARLPDNAAFLAKPVELTDLAQKIRDVLDQ
jgi:two-component system, cell cycle sensor histidine kinase and response regulator CckA